MNDNVFYASKVRALALAGSLRQATGVHQTGYDKNTQNIEFALFSL